MDVEFTGQLPAIYNALTVDYSMPGGVKTKLTLEVQQHLGENWVRAVAMSTTEGLKRGYDVIDAANGKTGLRLFHEQRPDLVVLDVGLPDLDGWEVLERLRELSVPVPLQGS